MAIKINSLVTFNAIDDDRSSTGKLRVIIPKVDYMIVAEDDGYYYLAKTMHIPSDFQEKLDTTFHGSSSRLPQILNSIADQAAQVERRSDEHKI